LTTEDLAEYSVAWRRPVRVRYRDHEVVSNPPPSSGGVLIAYGLALLEHVGRGGPAARVARVARGVMREQTRVRDGGFTGDLYRGGLAAAAALEESLAAAVMRIEASLHASRSTRRRAARLTSPSWTRTATPHRSPSTGSGSGVVVPGTGIQLNNMLGEYDWSRAVRRHRPPA